ncbi:MAG: CHASE2 domain-containing protein [candidate division Zixibacteria bacterium]|nr:CHASE2 domain-containing protein [candidate division Zixibacteria bacterium]
MRDGQENGKNLTERGTQDLNRNNMTTRFNDMLPDSNKRTAVLLSILITVFAIFLALEKPSYIEKFELSINDIIYNLGVDKGNLDDIIIVGIDDQSINKIGRWPWHRNRLAELVSGIALQNPKVIGLDVLLQRDFEQDTLGYTDQLASAIKAAGNVVVPYYFTLSKSGQIVDDDTPEFIYRNSYVLFDNPLTIGSYPIPRAKEVFPPADQIGTAASAVGYVNIIPDIDNKVRYEPMVVSYNSHYFPSFASQISRLYLGLSAGGVKVNGGKSIQIGSTEVRTDASMRIPIKYSGGYNTFKYISALDILDGNVKSGKLVSKIILVGYVAADNRDIVATPLTEVLPGVEKQASVIENLINANILRGVKAVAWINLLIMLLFGAFGILVLPKLSLNFRLLMILGCLFLLFNAGYFVFANFEIMLQFFYPALELVMFLGIAPLYSTEQSIGRSKQTRVPVTRQDSTIGAGSIGISEHSEASQTIITNISNIEKMGRYKIEGILGKGAMGTVYKGIDPAIGRPVAIKTIRIDIIDSQDEQAEMVKRLTAEAHSAGKLSHPNIITIYDVGQERNLQYIAMEFLQGKTLEEIVKEEKEIDPMRVAKFMMQTADALSYAHSQKVVHRDIKPANIMIIEDDIVKVMDFGIARTDNMHMTQTGITVGTPNYISPEQLQGGEVDGRADIFSSGVVLYETLCGQKPFKGDNISALVVQILNFQPEKPSSFNPTVSDELDRITMKALEKDRTKRYQKAGELVTDLKKVLGDNIPIVETGEQQQVKTPT